MSLENKTIGIVFIGNFVIKENLKYELIKLKTNYNINIIPIIKRYKTNINIDQIMKITKNEPIFYDKGIILEKNIKNFDFLILVGCGDNIISKISNQKFDNNILKLIKYSKLKHIPIIIGINIKKFNYISLMNIENLYKSKICFFIPFKITNPITKPDKISFDPGLLSKTISFASNGIQIKPILNFL